TWAFQRVAEKGRVMRMVAVAVDVGGLQHKPEGDFSSCIESCFPLTDNVSPGDATANTLHAKQSLPHSQSLPLSVQMV
ncbi:putative phosphatase SPAC5H10.03, partial [Dissostichus eleginoides]